MPSGTISSSRRCGNGSAADPVRRFRQRSLRRPGVLLLQRSGIPLLEGYGLTEAGPVVSVNTLEPGRGRASVGQSQVWNFVWRRTGKSSCDLRCHVGYWNLDAETRTALDGGWLHTGDLGGIDSGGFLTITGRKKDLIVTSGGKNISPLGIEERLRSSP